MRELNRRPVGVGAVKLSVPTTPFSARSNPQPLSGGRDGRVTTPVAAARECSTTNIRRPLPLASPSISVNSVEDEQLSIDINKFQV